jgi:predicted transcriptional regulator
MEKELTKAEEQVMDFLWNLKQAFVKDIVQKMPDPKPAITTVSTIIRILEKKGFVSHESFGKTHRYFPLISREEYSAQCTRSLMHRYFSNSVGNLVSFFSKKENLSLEELEELQNLIHEEIQKKKKS